MRQFEIYRIKNSVLVCVLRHDFLYDHPWIMVAPLIPSNDPPVKGLAIAVHLDGARHLLELTHQFPIKRITGKPVALLEDRRDEILDGLNLLYWGL